MNQQKRKRGRPCKDESLPRQHSQPSVGLAAAPPLPNVITTIQQLSATMIPCSNNLSKVDYSMVGQAVTCVIDGIFDNGYLLSTRLGPNNSILRGIVFQQPVNDVVPRVEMCTTTEFPIPPSNPRSPIQISTPQSVCEKQPPMVTGGSSISAPHESLRLVEQDDIMQVSNTVEEPQDSKTEHVVSDPTSESFQPVVNKTPNKQHELITPVETETTLAIVNDGLQQQTQGEVSNVEANQDPNPEVAVDLSLNNFPEI